MSDIDQPRLGALIAAILTDACARYQALIAHLAPAAADPQVWESQRAYLRREAFDIAALIATAGRGADLAHLTHGPGLDPRHDARRVAPLLRMIGDSALLIAAAPEREDLAQVPYAPAELVAAAAARLEVREWLAANEGGEIPPPVQ